MKFIRRDVREFMDLFTFRLSCNFMYILSQILKRRQTAMLEVSISRNCSSVG